MVKAFFNQCIPNKYCFPANVSTIKYHKSAGALYISTLRTPANMFSGGKEEENSVHSNIMTLLILALYHVCIFRFIHIYLFI
jgi:hypothetical protein